MTPAHARSIALMRFLAGVANELLIGRDTYVVGGAVRNWILGVPIKDLDLVIDSKALGRDSSWFAKRLTEKIPAQTSLVTNQYGVAILTVSTTWKVEGVDLKGENIEIANARQESYGGPGGKGYKPHEVVAATIVEDLDRREFTFNTLLWRLGDLTEGPWSAEVLDFLGTGKADLAAGILRTPQHPDKTFSDDPTRMLRAVKFVAKYGFTVSENVLASIQENAPKLKDMPWDAVRKLVVDIFDIPEPRKSLALMAKLGLAATLGEMMRAESGFATAIGRTLVDRDIHLAFDLLDLNWPMKSPVSFLSKAEHETLRGILAEKTSADFDKSFVGSFMKPPIDQMRIFTKLDIAPKDRGRVIAEARKALLGDPSLMDRPLDLEATVEAALSG